MSQARTYPMFDAAAVAGRVKAAGGPAIDPTQSSGKATADGVTVSWLMANDQIMITIINKPWIAPYAAIWTHIDAVVDSPGK